MKSPNGLLAAVLLLVAVPALAQTTTQSTTTPTLSDLAKRAQEKKGTPPATNTFTNDDLKNAGTSPADETSRPADGKTADGKDASKSADGKGAKSGDASKPDEAAWKKKDLTLPALTSVCVLRRPTVLCTPTASALPSVKAFFGS